MPPSSSRRGNSQRATESHFINRNPFVLNEMLVVLPLGRPLSFSPSLSSHKLCECCWLRACHRIAHESRAVQARACLSYDVAALPVECVPHTSAVELLLVGTSHTIINARKVRENATLFYTLQEASEKRSDENNGTGSKRSYAHSSATIFARASCIRASSFA